VSLRGKRHLTTKYNKVKTKVTQREKYKDYKTMPKSQNINPGIVRKPQFIEFGKIPVNQYNKSIEVEKKTFSGEDFIRIFLEEYFAAMGVKAEIKENLTKLRVTVKSGTSKV